MKRFYIMMILLAVVIGLSACGVSEEEVVDSITEKTDEYFDVDSPAVTHEFALFDIYIPETAEITEEAENYLVIEDQNQTYILFSNNLEDPMSDSFYSQAETMDHHLLLESYEDDERFGYLQLSELEDDYEIQIGIGGIRMTTHSSLDDAEQQLEKMSQIINSIEFN
ncbi:hypothetical protein SAMN05421734_10318 [Pelagirhabdus alkalitolerans]|uniref:DUF4367 domain-containing protein n=1 Tax=Pelagirhabdus alkalitolerans TaxID=1612202 RepID=A0A1G6HI57_9BACI|nr:hypothetical protein [Pelagirhabdus alkalitolerans]SDB93930.1 hypothetical protein SAMN05421734_10318 [Pelagirhabdus alkalitolerans]